MEDKHVLRKCEKTLFSEVHKAPMYLGKDTLHFYTSVRQNWRLKKKQLSLLTSQRSWEATEYCRISEFTPPYNLNIIYAIVYPMENGSCISKWQTFPCSIQLSLPLITSISTKRSLDSWRWKQISLLLRVICKQE